MQRLTVNIHIDFDNYFYKNEYILFPAILDNKYEVAYLKLNKNKLTDFKELLNKKNQNDILQEKDTYLEYNKQYLTLKNVSIDMVFLSIIEQKHTLKNIIFALNFL